ncbi:MAG: 50S ribosomal protein L11 methyltransferase [Firmicutes bacterium]|nr:50S ribosomal protein L11 methyltransferase [Bacillota bacterium]
MNYTELKLYAPKETEDPLTLALEDLGIAGFAVNDPDDYTELFNKRNAYDWDYVSEDVKPEFEDKVVFTLYLDDTPEGLELMEKILSEADYLGVTDSAIRTVSDDDWKDKWKEWFKPAKVGERIVVKPSWEAYEKLDPAELVIEIDPGMAFGTGTHETTSLCMRLMEKYQKPGDKVLDVGCGSGILSIAAALLEAGDILAVDIDPIAVEVSKENAELNGLADRMTIQEGDLTKGLSYKADVVVANLMADLVILLSAHVMKHLVPGGIYISSGILVEKRDQVRAAVEAAGFEILEIPEDGEWCAIAAKAPAYEA